MKRTLAALCAVASVVATRQTVSAEDFTFTLSGSTYYQGRYFGNRSYNGTISGLDQGSSQTPGDLQLTYDDGTADFGPNGSFDVEDGQITNASFDGSTGGHTLQLYGASGGSGSEYNGAAELQDGSVSYTPVAGTYTPPPSGGGGGGPEPSTWALMMVGVFGAGAALRGRGKRAGSLTPA